MTLALGADGIEGEEAAHHARLPQHCCAVRETPARAVRLRSAPRRRKDRQGARPDLRGGHPLQVAGTRDPRPRRPRPRRPRRPSLPRSLADYSSTRRCRLASMSAAGLVLKPTPALRSTPTHRLSLRSRAGLGSWLSLPSAPPPPSCRLQPSSAKAPCQSCMRSLLTPRGRS